MNFATKKIQLLMVFSIIIFIKRSDDQAQTKKSPNFIRTKDRHRITYVLVS